MLSNPLSPQELFQSLIKRKKRIGLTSIYRSLDLFESLGIVFKIVNGSNVNINSVSWRITITILSAKDVVMWSN